MILLRCQSCKTDKAASREFFHARGEGFQKYCKECRADRRLQKIGAESEHKREDRLARARSATDSWRDRHPARVLELGRKYNRIHGPKRNAAASTYARNNRRKINDAKRRRRISNAEAHRAAEKRRQERFRASPRVRAERKISERIREALKGKKAGMAWEKMVGFTKEELASHLEKQFLPGMSWDNYGNWHVDHILPRAMFHYTSADHPDFKMCWALTNLRPLWALENQSKGGRRLLLI